ncbi:RNA polymerase sigma-70 factor [Spirosoma arcticum]
MLPFPTDPNASSPLTGREESNSRILDTELFIRNAYQHDARQGFDLLFRRYYKPLCSHAMRFLYEKEQAQDVVADVFLSFWKNQVHTYLTSPYRSYLFAAVRKRAISQLQAYRLDSPDGSMATDTNELPYGDFEDPQQILQYTELYLQIEAKISQLPPQCQRVFLLSRVEGLKHREIADELHISLKTVEAHLNKALAQLHKVVRLLFLFIHFW